MINDPMINIEKAQKRKSQVYMLAALASILVIIACVTTIVVFNKDSNNV